MKFFVLLHNQIMMTQASIMNSTEPWFGTEVEEVRKQLTLTVTDYHMNGYLTEYQLKKLCDLIAGIEPRE